MLVQFASAASTFPLAMTFNLVSCSHFLLPLLIAFLFLAHTLNFSVPLLGYVCPPGTD